MNKMEIYEATRSVPEIAKKPIKGGRLSGMTDINPMWRIKTLTEQFGVCGVGWYTEIVNKEIYPVGNEVIVSVDCNLYIKVDDEWSKPICGTGGAKLISNESKGLYNDDEAFKKAETDAISVCCKKLGIGADVYWSKDGESKYSKPEETTAKPKYKYFCEECENIIPEDVDIEKMKKATLEEFGGEHFYCRDCFTKLKAEKNGK